MHVPFAVAPAATEQASQPELHSLSQHSPSAQKPDTHWVPALQERPVTILGAQTDPDVQ